MKKYLTKEGIFNGIIASILFTFLLQPIISLLIAQKGLLINGLTSFIILNCTKATYTTLMDSFVICIFSVVLGIGIDILLSVLTDYIKKHKRTYSKSIDKPEEKAQKVGDKLLEIDKNIAKLEKKIALLKIWCAIILIMWVCMVFGVYILPSSMYNRVIISIERITPYVQEERIDQMKSDWRLMKNWDDYKNLTNEISQIEEENNLK